MAILAQERRENVKASLFKYLADNFILVPIEFPGVGLDEENQNEWVRVDIMYPEPRYVRQTDGNKMGSEAIVMLSMNIFRKQTFHETGNVYGLDRIVDTLSNLFRVPLGILVKDYVENAGVNTIGVLQTSRLVDENLGLRQEHGVYQYNLTSYMRYVFQWERP